MGLYGSPELTPPVPPGPPARNVQHFFTGVFAAMGAGCGCLLLIVLIIVVFAVIASSHPAQ